MALALPVPETGLDLTGFRDTVEDLLAGFLDRKAPARRQRWIAGPGRAAAPLP
ncbi:hypothetical protein LV779_02740 [Streptomyces thinghirensis]|nr:hypothetical protein [Streptomyces thinghirensis]